MYFLAFNHQQRVTFIVGPNNTFLPKFKLLLTETLEQFAWKIPLDRSQKNL